MTLDDCYQQNQGTAILTPGGGAGNNGQCVQWADTVLHEVYGFPYIYTPAASDWWHKAEALGLTTNFDLIPVGAPILAGDFIVYGPLSANDQQGHIDTASRDGIPSDFWAYDSNWDAADFHDSAGYPTLHEVHHTGYLNSYILGYLRLKGGDMSQLGLNEARILDWGLAGRNGINGAPNSLAGENDADLNANHVGKDALSEIDAFWNSDECIKWRNTTLPALVAADAPQTIEVGGVTYVRQD